MSDDIWTSVLATMEALLCITSKYLTRLICHIPCKHVSDCYASCHLSGCTSDHVVYIHYLSKTPRQRWYRPFTLPSSTRKNIWDMICFVIWYVLWYDMFCDMICFVIWWNSIDSWPGPPLASSGRRPLRAFFSCFPFCFCHQFRTFGC
jgi:hypothetical protein